MLKEQNNIEEIQHLLEALKEHITAYVAQKIRKFLVNERVNSTK